MLLGELNNLINVDLHIHSFASKHKELSDIVDNSKVEHLDVLLSKLNAKNINLFAFSDHNTFDANLF